MDYGLLGQHLHYSFSQEIHQALGNENYRLFPTEPEDLEEFLQKKTFLGLNVTIPYKQAVIPFCDALDPVAQAIGAVNTIYKNNGRWIGGNTDYAGFLYLLKKARIPLEEKKILILGSGGASAMVQYAAKKSNAAKIIVAGRRGPVDYDHLPQDAEIIINATPLGTYPQNHQRPLNLEDFPHCQGAVDLVYNPLSTSLVLQAKSRGIPATGGLPMLVAQAARAMLLFTGQGKEESDQIPENHPIKAQILQVENQIAQRMSNVVLIGMPGSGKTTIATALGNILNKKVVDLDWEIQKHEGQSPAEILREKGEEVFRDREEEILGQVAKENNQIIATGGGSILREKNREALKQNGLIFWIQRPLEQLEQKDRPLSQSLNQLQKLQEKRAPLYGELAHYIIKNHTDPKESTREIAQRFQEHRF